MSGHRRLALLVLLLVVIAAAAWRSARDREDDSGVAAAILSAPPVSDSSGSLDPRAKPVAAGTGSPAKTPDRVVDAAARPPFRAQAPSAPTPSLAQARELMARLAEDRDCERAARALTERSQEPLERSFWKWLPPEQAAAERAARQQVAVRRSQGCAQWSDAPAARAARHQALAAQEALALQAGDFAASLSAASRGKLDDTGKARLRALLYDALLSGDVNLIARLGDSNYALDRAGWLHDPVRRLEPQVWQLIACDLGRPCGRSSLALDRMCLYSTTAACDQDSVEAALRYTTPEHQFARMDARRRELLARIRSGQIAGIFDPIPPPGP